MQACQRWNKIKIFCLGASQYQNIQTMNQVVLYDKSSSRTKRVVTFTLKNSHTTSKRNKQLWRPCACWRQHVINPHYFLRLNELNLIIARSEIIQLRTIKKKTTMWTSPFWCQVTPRAWWVNKSLSVTHLFEGENTRRDHIFPQL